MFGSSAATMRTDDDYVRARMPVGPSDAASDIIVVYLCPRWATLEYND